MGFRERLLASSKSNSSRVIVALDYAGPESTRVEDALAFVSAARDRMAGVKVNFQLLLPGGIGGMRDLAALCAGSGLPMIADIKLNDIESTNLAAVDTLFGGGFDAVIANPFVGLREGLSEVLKRSRETDKGVLLLVYMSHRGADEGYGLESARGPMYRIFAERARDWEADGVIVSSKPLAILREVRTILSDRQLILSPGVGAQGGDAATAIKAGTDFVIAGRSIIGAEKPLEALADLNLQISKS